MQLLRDETAYREVLGDFVACAIDTDTFLARFAHLWLCDAAACVDATRSAQATDEQYSNNVHLYALLDGLNALCGDYVRSLLPGREYRVSAEQFRKEVQARVRGSPLLPPV